MQELRFVAVSEDGRYAVLAVPGRSARFTLPIDERLRAVALGQASRLAQYEIEVENPLRPKEIQARIRAGETAEEIADAAGVAVERVRWFEGPVLAERAHMADRARMASVRRQGDSAPAGSGPPLDEVVEQRLNAIGADPDETRWDARKRGDGHWQVQLAFTVGGRPHLAEWAFDPRRRHAVPADDNAARMSLPGAEALQPVASPHGEATVTQLAPRLSAAARGAVPHAAPQPRTPAAQAARPHEGGAVGEPASAPASTESGRDGAATAQAPQDGTHAAAEAEPAEQPQRPDRKAARGRRSSVPSWDEIMFGNNRGRD
ncbi:MAG: DUF3071 domain-containing protein [Streptosporangiaceae bacterium]|nr:DUF3071 domain-containing protein [Streptosporangiaceae bacterium]